MTELFIGKTQRLKDLILRNGRLYWATPKLTDKVLKQAEAEGKEVKQISSAQTYPPHQPHILDGAYDR